MPASAQKKKDPAAVAPGRKGGKKGGLARAAKLTPAERSEGARKAVQARWAKLKANGSETAPVMDTSKKALSACLKRIKETSAEKEILRLTEQLQRIIFRRQYRNAKA
jgi:hypothetical protein